MVDRARTGGAAHGAARLTGPQPWIAGEAAATDARRHAPATERNRDAIAAVLADWLPATGVVLEIASGSGEHAVHFARLFPGLDWQPSDPDQASLASIAAWRDEAELTNLCPPLALDAATTAWPVAMPVAAVLCINMVHISPWAACKGLFAGSAWLLAPGAPLILYGPYIEAGVATAESNLAFDASLKARNPAWGLRHLDAVTVMAHAAGFQLFARRAMPANNIMLCWKRSA